MENKKESLKTKQTVSLSVYSGVHNPKKNRLTSEEIENIKREINNKEFTLNTIAKKYKFHSGGTMLRHLRNIGVLESYNKRQVRKKFSSEQLNEIKEKIINPKNKLHVIAKEYGFFTSQTLKKHIVKLDTTIYKTRYKNIEQLKKYENENALIKQDFKEQENKKKSLLGYIKEKIGYTE
jgi:hypothetical protein